MDIEPTERDLTLAREFCWGRRGQVNHAKGPCYRCRVIARAMAAERERCIQVMLDGQAMEGDPPIVRERLARALDRIAAAIRALPPRRGT